MSVKVDHAMLVGYPRGGHRRHLAWLLSARGSALDTGLLTLDPGSGLTALLGSAHARFADDQHVYAQAAPPIGGTGLIIRA